MSHDPPPQRTRRKRALRATITKHLMAHDICGDYGGRSKQSGEPCERPAGWGCGEETTEGRCKHHLGTSPDGSSHEGNQHARTHGAFSEHFRSDLTDTEINALDAIMSHLDGIDDERTLASEVAGEALLKYKRSADSRFLREARQWMSEFNLLPNEDTLNVGGTDGNPLNVLVQRERYDGDE